MAQQSTTTSNNNTMSSSSSTLQSTENGLTSLPTLISLERLNSSNQDEPNDNAYKIPNVQKSLSSQSQKSIQRQRRFGTIQSPKTSSQVSQEPIFKHEV